MAPPTRLAGLLLTLPLALSACGQTTKDSANDFQGAQKAVAQTVEDLQTAGRKSDTDKICNKLLAPALVAKIKTASRGTCQQVLKDVLTDTDSYELQVKKVTITGTTANVVVESSGGSKDRADTLQLVKDGAAWKIATLGGPSS